jgi:predicted nucleotidyltransferase
VRRSEALRVLGECAGDLCHRFSLSEITLFGSVARDEARDDSDVDVLVSFEGPLTFDRYFGLKGELEERLKSKVDLVTRSGLRPRVLPYIEQDSIRVS